MVEETCPQKFPCPLQLKQRNELRHMLILKAICDIQKQVFLVADTPLQKESEPRLHHGHPVQEKHTNF